VKGLDVVGPDHADAEVGADIRPAARAEVCRLGRRPAVSV